MLTSDVSRLLLAIVAVTLGVNALIDPTEVYTGGFSVDNSSSDILLRIATGRAGQSSLVKVLADAFIQEGVKNGSQPFSIGWVLSDTTFTIKNLARGDADLGISYLPDAEKLAGDQGIIDYQTGRFYLFRDHFVIGGPLENPAGVKDSMDATTIFAKIYQAGELNNAKTAAPTRFLTRFDKSATNLKESSLWLGIGQVPWSLPYSTWYHQFPAFPIQALTTAILLKEYTLTDFGTCLSLQQLQPNLTTSMQIFKKGTDSESDPLLLPGHLLVGMKARNATLAMKFANWAVGKSGQSVVTGFKKGGVQLYSGAP